MDHVPLRRAVLSVSDKTGLTELATELAAAGVELLSTGGTRTHLEKAGLKVRDLSDYTGFPEMMGGRVKTLHPKVFGGILARRSDPSDLASAEQHGMSLIDLVVVNLYPFEATIAKPGTTFAEAKEQIDIGGPSLIRAAAKNHAYTAVVTEPAQYAEVLAEFRANQGTTLPLRRKLAGAAFERTARYDRAIADYLAADAAPAEAFPPSIQIQLGRHESLRYGENPHQPAAWYLPTGGEAGSLATLQQLHGKELSYNNLLDVDSAWALARSLPGAAAAVIKHNNPCGAASGATLAEAASNALDGDPQSAFGCVMALSREVDEATAQVLVAPGRFIEVIVAPGFTAAAKELITTVPKWKNNVRLIAIAAPAPPRRTFRFLDCGVLVQEADVQADPESEWKVVTKTAPTEAQLADLRFAWQVVRQVKSNAIVVAAKQAAWGVGAGQMSRVDAVQIALDKAGAKAVGGVLASDAFFPFPDSIHKAAAAGVAALIQPGGSVKDADAIAACDEHGLAMVFTGLRHFKH